MRRRSRRRRVDRRSIPEPPYAGKESKTAEEFELSDRRDVNYYATYFGHDNRSRWN